MPNKPTVLYRYMTDQAHDGARVCLTLQEYKIVKHTPHGYQIPKNGYCSWYMKDGVYTGPTKWVSSDESLRKFAYTDKDKALIHYKHRTRKYIDILQFQLARAMAGLACCKEMTELEEGSTQKCYQPMPNLHSTTQHRYQDASPFDILGESKPKAMEINLGSPTHSEE